MTDGHSIKYTVSEDAVANYTSKQDGNNFTNTIEQDYVSVSGEKIWKVPSDLINEIPESVTVKLFQDEVEYDTTTASAADWTFTFNDLPKYDLTDGHAYDYTVEEVAVPGYDSTIVPVGENEFNIVNTFIRDGATTNVTVQKLWNDLGANVTTHSAITVDLYQNGMKYETVELNDETGWNFIFEGLPKYDANQQPYKYTVQEQPIAGYTGWVSDPILLLDSGDTAFVIENTLILGKPGEITVTKKVTGDERPRADIPFKFELQIGVTRPAGTNVLFEASALADLTLDEAASHLNDTISGLRAEAMLTTGSQYQYEYVLTERENEFTDAMAVMAMDVTSPSAIIFDTDEQFVVTRPETEEYEMKVNLLDTIVSLLNDLSVEREQDLTDKTMEEVLVDIFEQLAAEVPMSEGCTMALDKGTVEDLIVAAIAYDNALNSYEDEHQPIETTTPSALQVFMNGKAVTPSALIYVEDGGYYKLAFELVDGESAIFNVQATTGSAIRYNIVEHLTDATSGENYINTEIAFGVDSKVDGTVLGWTAFDAEQMMAYTFYNNYKKATTPPVGPVDPDPDPDPVDPPEVIIPDPEPPLVEPEEPTVDPTEPTEEITDPDVPLIDVPGEEVEIPEPEVPLGDAPKTGDTNNAVPFVVLMMAAGLGLVITRRRFN